MIRLRRVLLVVYCLSGCAALIYEVVWTRLLTQQIGQSVWAVSTVLAAFMAGLGGGALVGGRAALRRSPVQALKLYAALEGLIACCALAMPIVLPAVTAWLAFSYDDGVGGGFAAARLGVTLVLLTLPAAAMGATFPVAARALPDSADRPGSMAGALYASNTAGACAGAMLAGFLLVPMLGLQRTSLCAVALNVLAGGLAMWLAAADAAPRSTAAAATMAPARERQRASHVGHAGAASLRTPRTSLAVSPTVLAACALGLTGFAALVNEVAWTRVLALTIGPTTYAFSGMLTLFILGLAIGSAVAARLTAQIRQPVTALGLVLVLAGVAALAAMAQVETLTLRVADLVRGANVRFGEVLRGEMTMWAALLLPMAAAFGAAFPLALRVAVQNANRAPRDASLVYAANTAGAIVGSLAAGFLLVPLLGLQRTIEAAALLVMTGGVVTLAASPVRRTITVAAGAAVAMLGGLAVQAGRWDATLLSAGAYKYAPYVQGPDLESALSAGSLRYYIDGPAATVSVRRAAGVQSLAIDGKVDASNGGDMLTQKLLAHVPLLLHPRPRSVAIIGLGSGVTLGAALRHPIARADTIEISREVVDASSFFAAENHHALADPRARLIVGDGRSHLLLASAPYDVIISEPSNPWMAGVASLFTREFFLAARRALAADGILCQWAHTYDISGRDLRSIAATFASVFPDGTIWLVGAGDVLLIASPAGIVPRLGTIEASFARPGVASDLADVAVPDAAAVIAMYSGGPSELGAYAAGAIVQTDDRTTLEFSAARAIVGAGEDNASVLRNLTALDRLPSLVVAARSPSDVARWGDRGRMLLQAEAYDSAYDAFAKAVAHDADSQPAVDGLVRAAAGAGRPEAATALLAALAAQQPRGIAVRIGLSRLLASSGDAARGLEQVMPLMAAGSTDPRPTEQAAAILGDLGDAGRLRPLAEHLNRHWPQRSSGPYFLATTAFLEGRLEEAERLAGSAVNAHPSEARLRTLAGAASASLGRRDAARAQFDGALTISPRDPALYANLGFLDLEMGAPQSAIGRFAEALILDPSSAAAVDGLARALRQAGFPDRAARVEQTKAAAVRPR